MEFLAYALRSLLETLMPRPSASFSSSWLRTYEMTVSDEGTAYLPSLFLALSKLYCASMTSRAVTS